MSIHSIMDWKIIKIIYTLNNQFYTLISSLSLSSARSLQTNSRFGVFSNLLLIYLSAFCVPHRSTAQFSITNAPTAIWKITQYSIPRAHYHNTFCYYWLFLLCCLLPSSNLDISYLSLPLLLRPHNTTRSPTCCLYVTCHC